MGYPSYLLSVICSLRASSVADTGAGIGCKCFPGVALPLIVSWQCNGNSGLAFGGGTSFRSPGPHISTSRTLRAEPDGLSCLVAALEVFSSTTVFGRAFLPDSSYQHCLFGLHVLLSSRLILEEASSIHVLPSDAGRKLKSSCHTPAGQVLCIFVCLNP